MNAPIIMAACAVLCCLTPAVGVPTERELTINCAADGRVKVSAAVMGTRFTVQAYPGKGMTAKETQEACRKALACAVKWEKVMSSMDAESELARLNAAPAGVEIGVSAELREVLAKALEYAELTDGAFDPTLGPCVRLWKKSLRQSKLPDAETLAKALKSCGWQKLKLTERGVIKTVEGMRVELGGIGKGVGTLKMAAALKEAGIESFCLDTTSDICAGAPPPGKAGWSVMVKRHDGEEAVLLRNACISTSGGGRQYALIDGVCYAHVLNPKTGLGVTEQWQVSVMTDDAALADALATAGCVLGKEAFELVASKKTGIKVLSFFKTE